MNDKSRDTTDAHCIVDNCHKAFLGLMEDLKKEAFKISGEFRTSPIEGKVSQLQDGSASDQGRSHYRSSSSEEEENLGATSNKTHRRRGENELTNPRGKSPRSQGDRKRRERCPIGQRPRKSKRTCGNRLQAKNRRRAALKNTGVRKRRGARSRGGERTGGCENRNSTAPIEG